MLAQLEGVGFAARVSVDTPARLNKAAKAVMRAFQTQTENKGMGFVEILSSCPTNWGMTPLESNERIAREMIPYFPLGIYKDRDAD
jgi:2-oxoglutarate ferredoxin oxidoreductase subunit beta